MEEESPEIECQYVKRLIGRLDSLPNRDIIDFAEVRKAIYWAKKYHAGQYRKSGEPFYSHPLEVASMIIDYDVKTSLVVGSILHDIVEDTEVTIGMILDNFGWRIAEIVDLLTRDRPDGTKLTVEEILNNAYEAGDKDALLIKLVDRMHNASTTDNLSAQKRKKLYKETLQHFIPLSLHLNIQNIERNIINLTSEDTLYKRSDGYLNKIFSEVKISKIHH